MRAATRPAATPTSPSTPTPMRWCWRAWTTWPAARYARRFGPLTEGEQAMARTAWKYFENNTQPTGLANAVDNYPSTTMWDTASYLGAIVAARELRVITPQQADDRLAKAIAALGSLAFFRDELPNKVYHTK